MVVGSAGAYTLAEIGRVPFRDNIPFVIRCTLQLPGVILWCYIKISVVEIALGDGCDRGRVSLEQLVMLTVLTEESYACVPHSRRF